VDVQRNVPVTKVRTRNSRGIRLSVNFHAVQLPGTDYVVTVDRGPCPEFRTEPKRRREHVRNFGRSQNSVGNTSGTPAGAKTVSGTKPEFRPGPKHRREQSRNSGRGQNSVGNTSGTDAAEREQRASELALCRAARRKTSEAKLTPAEPKIP
jgi:hypothetical protein